MLNPQLKITPALLRQVAELERLAGRWERIEQSDAEFLKPLSAGALEAGVTAAIELDVSLQRFPEEAHEDDFSEEPLLSQMRPPYFSAVSALYTAGLRLRPEWFSQQLTALLKKQKTVMWRRESARFDLPVNGRPEHVFETVQSFLVEQRLRELLAWLDHELSEGSQHRALLAAVFQLAFLQIYPFETGNHVLCQAAVWAILAEHGFSFVRVHHPAIEFQKYVRSYSNALRQAEKTAYGNWSTLNVWLDFFLEALATSARSALQSYEKGLRSLELTNTQRTILEIIRTERTSSREKIARQMGISESTLKYNLNALTRRGLIQRQGGGRSTSYRIS